MTIVNLLIGLVHELSALGAHHAYATRHGADGLAVTRRFLIVACRIPHDLHGLFRCSGWIRR